MLLEAGFPGFAAGTGPGVATVIALGSRGEGCKAVDLDFEEETAEEVARRSLARLKTLIDRFEDETTPYASLLHPMFKGRRYGDYDHLARVREWSLSGDEGSE